MAIKVEDENGVTRLLPEAHEVDQRIDDKFEKLNDDDRSRISSLEEGLEKELSRAQQAEEGLKIEIQQERARAEEKESLLVGSIEQEENRAVLAEKELEDKIGSEKDRATSAEQSLADYISEVGKGLEKEVRDREERDIELSSSIDKEEEEREKEISRIEGVIEGIRKEIGEDISQRLGDEISAREQADIQINGKITALQNKDDEIDGDIGLINSEISSIQQKNDSQDSSIKMAQETADRAESIARGRSQSKTFETYEEMQKWLSNPANTATLNIGDNLYIKDKGVPDYWWTGDGVSPLEGEKPDFSDYATNAQVDAIEESIREDLGADIKTAQATASTARREAQEAQEGATKALEDIALERIRAQGVESALDGRVSKVESKNISQDEEIQKAKDEASSAGSAALVAQQTAESRYTKPDNGIPEKDLEKGAQSALNLARTALQEVPSATASRQGTVQLGSDVVQMVSANEPSSENGRTFPVQRDQNKRLVVNVPDEGGTDGLFEIPYNLTDNSQVSNAVDFLFKNVERIKKGAYFIKSTENVAIDSCAHAGNGMTLTFSLIEGITGILSGYSVSIQQDPKVSFITRHKITKDGLDSDPALVIGTVGSGGFTMSAENSVHASQENEGKLVGIKGKKFVVVDGLDSAGTYPQMTVGKATNADSATRAINADNATKATTDGRGRDIAVAIDAKVDTSGGTLTGGLEIKKSSGDTYFSATRTDVTKTERTIRFGIGSGGDNRGIWDEDLDKWVFYLDSDNNLTLSAKTKIILNSQVYENSERVWSNNNRPSASLYQNNMDVTREGQTDTVYKYYKKANSSEWYRLWKSGWKEAGGAFEFTAKDNGTYTVNFPSAAVFSATSSPPTVLVTCGQWYNSQYACQVGLTELTASSFSFRVAGSTITKIFWYACGY